MGVDWACATQEPQGNYPTNLYRKEIREGGTGGGGWMGQQIEIFKNKTIIVEDNI